MKYFDRTEGESILAGSCFGKSFKSNGEYDGWYIRIRFPFAKTRTLIDVNSWQIITAKANFSVIFLKRKTYLKPIIMTGWAKCDVD